MWNKWMQNIPSQKKRCERASNTKFKNLMENTTGSLLCEVNFFNRNDLKKAKTPISYQILAM